MCVRLTNIGKTYSKALPKSESVIATGTRFGNDALCEVSPALERSPKSDGFIKESAETIPSSSVTNPISKEQNIIPLNRESVCCDFFGVTSRDSIQHKLHNQLALSMLKMEEQHIVAFPSLLLDNGYPYTCNIELLKTSVKNLLDSGTARLTMMGKAFGCENATHTIGLVFDKKNGVMYVLDSLPKSAQLKYRDALIRTLKDNNDIKLFFSGKPQQKSNEYTCNNWTHSNIEAVERIIQDGKILSEDELNAILPSDINEVLKSQMNYLTKDRKSEYSDLLKIFGI